MYINKIIYKNVGPIKDFVYEFRKNEAGNPVPLILVGKNGSGKSILLSNIVDSFYELADIAYTNATESIRNGHQYYKTIVNSQISFNESYLVSYINMEDDNKEYDYVFKSGNISFSDYCIKNGLSLDQKLAWKQDENFKKVTGNQDDVERLFSKNVICFFGPNRYFKPSWMGNKYNTSDNISTYSQLPRYKGNLNNPITATNTADLTLQWLFDIITDSRADLGISSGSLPELRFNLVYPNQSDILLFSFARQHAEKIMASILNEDVVFRMRNRSFGENRFSIIRKSDNRMVANSLDSLSTGQLALFNLFATIIRYADHNNIQLSYSLSEIKGIVLIDEIDLHLHTELQNEILPNLIALFPNIQFIVTSHSPLFLLGMQKKFGKDGIDVIEMPYGNKIDVEQFSEFENAYHYFTGTERYYRDIKNHIDSQQDRPLVVTEGATDWKHMKAAFNALKNDSRCSDWLSSLDFEFLEYEPAGIPNENGLLIQMGSDKLLDMCQQYTLIPRKRKLIFIADPDVKNVRESLTDIGQPYKKWENNVFSFVLPLPDHRKGTPSIAIEHYYTDEEITTPYTKDGITRRLYLGNEFDKDGISLDKKLLCNVKNSCGKNKINIIDGHESKSYVIRIEDDDRKNLALSKMKFANLVFEGKPPFDNIDFSSFIPLFEIIKQILEEE